jgi:hypothetical protein
MIEQLVDGAIGFNLVTNGNMEQWSAGASAAPDGFTLTGTGATIARSSTKRQGLYSALVTYGSSDAYLYQDYLDFTRFQGENITAGVYVLCSTAAIARITISDGVGSTSSSYHTGGGGWELLTVTRAVDGAATRVRIEMHVEGAGNALFDIAKLEEGEVATAFVPNNPPASISHEAYNLIVTTASVSTIDVDADEIILHNVARESYRAISVNLTIDITASGANGLDTGAEATAEYYVWVIYNPSTDTVAGLLSLSATAPTMPSGYTYKALVSACKNDTDLVLFYQRGKEVLLDVPEKIGNNVGSTTTAGISLAVASLPTNISGVSGKVMANTGTVTFFWHYITFSNSLSADNAVVPYSLRLAISSATATWTLPVIDAGTPELKYQISANTVDIWVSGYTLA